MIPKIDTSPVYETELKVMGKKVSYSPFKVGQEKALIAALENDKTDEIVKNYENVLKTCIKDEIDWDTLTMVDYVTLIVKVRTKSKGETLSLVKKECDGCKKGFEAEVDLDNALKYENEDVKKSVVEINKDLSFEIRPLSYQFFFGLEDIKDEMDLYLHTAANCIAKIVWNGKIYKVEDKEELKENVLLNLNKYQLEKIFVEYQKLITMYLEIGYECPLCGHKEVVKMDNFLKSIK